MSRRLVLAKRIMSASPPLDPEAEKALNAIIEALKKQGIPNPTPEQIQDYAKKLPKMSSNPVLMSFLSLMTPTSEILNHVKPLMDWANSGSPYSR